MSVKDDVYFSFQDEAIRKILSKLLEKAKAFLNPDYGLKKSDNGLRNMAHEINAFVKEARDVKVEYHNMNTQANGFVIATVTATIPEQTNQ
jgi:hypothetical protein